MIEIKSQLCNNTSLRGIVSNEMNTLAFMEHGFKTSTNSLVKINDNENANKNILKPNFIGLISEEKHGEF
jgi:hypothetical protein